MAKKEKKVITKKDWVSKFNLIGEAKVNDFTYTIDEEAEKSSWVSNRLNLGIDCGEKHGIVYCSMFGGYYSEGKENYLKAYGKKDDGTVDFDNQMQIAWEDRNDESILENVSDYRLITVGLEKTDKGKTFYKKFLSPYDAIKYIKNCLKNGMIVNIKGNLKYELANDKVVMKKEVESIVLSKVENPANYKATFMQTVLLDKDSAKLKSENIDKEKGIMYVSCQVLDYMKELNGIEIKGQYPFRKDFEFEMDFNDEKRCKLIIDKLFKVRKGITQVTFEGDFVCGGATVTATLDDIPEEIKDLILSGVYSEEEALQRCSTNGKREERMILRKPNIRLVGEGDKKTPVLQKFEERYTEDDLILDYLNDFKDIPDDEELPFGDSSDGESGEEDQSLDWLNRL